MQYQIRSIQGLPVARLQSEAMETEGKVLIQRELNLMSFEAGPQRTHEKESLKYCWWKEKNTETKNREGKRGWRKRSWKDNTENIYHHQLQRYLENSTPALQRLALGEWSLWRQRGWTVSSATTSNLEVSALLRRGHGVSSSTNR